VSSELKLILEVIPSGSGNALDLGGGRGELRRPLEQLGWRYYNLDVKYHADGNPDVIGDAHRLPFQNGAFSLVVSKDSLEHFVQPWVVIQEVYRVLKDGGYLVIWVPFMHPFHEDDFYRFTPLGLHQLLRDFEIVLFDSPKWVFTVIGLAMVEVSKKMKLRFLEPSIKQLCYGLDRCFIPKRSRPASFANAYRIVAKKRFIDQEANFSSKDLLKIYEEKMHTICNSFLAHELVKIMCCPKCRGELLLTQDGRGLDCPACSLRYPVQDGIPIMLIDRALPLGE